MEGRGPVCYVLLCGQAALLLGNLLLLQGVSRSHQHNATDSPARGQEQPAETPAAAAASSPTASHTWDYLGPYAPLVLCDHL